MKKIVMFFALLGLIANAPAQNKKFRTDSLKVMYHLDAKGNANVRDSLVVTNNVHANKYYGDGSHLSGVSGSVAEAPVDLVLGADSDINGSGDVIFKAGGVEKARMLNNGNWGLGVSAPTSLLRLHTSGSTALQMTNSITGSTSADGIILSLRADNGNFGLRMLDSLDVFFETDGLERMRIDASGRVLLGHTSTNITGSLIANSSIVVANDDSNLVSMGIGGGVVSISSARNPGATVSYLPLTFWTSGAKRMTIDTTTGNIGLKVTSPVSLLHVNQDTFYTAAGGLKITTANTGQALADGASLFFDSSDNFFIKSHQVGYLSLQTDATERVRIGADGHVGIGAAAGTSVALDVTSTDGALRVPRMTQTQRDALTASAGMQVYSTSTNKFYFRQNAAWDSLGGVSYWSKPTSNRLELSTLSDTVRVNKLRVGTSSTAGYVLTMDAEGNAAPAAAPSGSIDLTTSFDWIEEFVGGTTVSGGIGDHGWSLYRQDGSEPYGFPTSGWSTNRYGEFYLATNNPSNVSIYLAEANLLFDNGYFETAISIPSTSGNLSLWIGLGADATGANCNSLTSQSTDAVGFEFQPSSSANWKYGAKKDGNGSPSTSSVAVTTGYHRLKFVVNAGRTSIEFFVDGSSIGTISSNIPNGASDTMRPIMGCRYVISGLYKIDYLRMKFTVSR